MEEKALLARLRQGDPEAAAELFDRYFDRIYRFVYHQVGGRHADAEDVVQETFIAALRSLPTFRGESQLYTWLYRIATFKVADFYRHRRRDTERRARFSLDDWKLIHGDLSPEQLLQEEEARQQVWAALAALPDHYREALVLKYIEGLSVEEVAQVMGRSFKSVESILVRARRALANLLLQQDRE